MSKQLTTNLDELLGDFLTGWYEPLDSDDPELRGSTNLNPVAYCTLIVIAEIWRNIRGRSGVPEHFSQMRALSLGFRPRHISIWVLATILVVIWIGYLFIGQELISGLYNSQNSWLAARFMVGRGSTSVEAYYRRADSLLLHGTVGLVLAYVALRLLRRNLPGLFLSGFSFLASSFLLFVFFETFPSLLPLTHLDNILGYYAYKSSYIPDPELVFREKPFNRRIIRELAATQYSRRYAIEVEPYSIEWIMDKDGFRNQRAVDSADIVVMGDSYIEYGSNEADTFVGRLEAKLPGLSVRNLGKSGYAPAQYIHVLKRFGLQNKPRLSVMAVYEGNDIPETRDYLLWKSGRTGELHRYLFRFATNSLWRRYIAAASATMLEFRKVLDDLDQVLLQTFAAARGYPQKTHPDIAIINLRERLYPKLFIDKLPEAPVEQMLATEEFQAIKNIFAEFRQICQTNGIAAVVLYIPTAVQIYAPYTSGASGLHWLQMRERQIAARENTEKAIKIIAGESRVDFISLTPVFHRAAAEGKMIYYSLDAHWNAEGREIAAQFMADTLKKRYPTTSRHKEIEDQRITVPAR
jgi:hypothetical protein